jgi:hypothetical protein
VGNESRICRCGNKERLAIAADVIRKLITSKVGGYLVSHLVQCSIH